jgi:hypothetical protein
MRPSRATVVHPQAPGGGRPREGVAVEVHGARGAVASLARGADPERTAARRPGEPVDAAPEAADRSRLAAVAGHQDQVAAIVVRPVVDQARHQLSVGRDARVRQPARPRAAPVRSAAPAGSGRLCFGRSPARRRRGEVACCHLDAEAARLAALDRRDRELALLLEALEVAVIQRQGELAAGRDGEELSRRQIERAGAAAVEPGGVDGAG